MSKAREVLNWTLENKKLDVEIKREQLEREKLLTRETRAKIARADSLIGQLDYQDGQIRRQRGYLEDSRNSVKRLSEENALLANQLNGVQDDLRSSRTKLQELRSIRAVKLVLWIQKLFSPSSPLPSGKIPHIVPTKRPWETALVGNIRNVNIISPEVKAMSADEFKKQYIDPIVLVDPAAL